MAYNDFGPGQNIKFFLITTGLDLDPRSGSIGFDNYEKIKRAITAQAEILMEEGIPRIFSTTGVNAVLPAYGPDNMKINQILFGTANYSDPWTAKSLTDEIEKVSKYPSKYPENGSFSINPYEFIEKGFFVSKNNPDSQNVLQWYPVEDFYFTEVMPGYNTGYDGSIRAVLVNDKIVLYIKQAFQWIRLDDYCESKSINFTISGDAPLEHSGDYWFKIGLANYYEFDSSIGNWNPGELLDFYEDPSLIGFSDGDKYIALKRGDLTLYEYNNGISNELKISNIIIRSAELNSTFSNAINDFNYIVETGQIALSGGKLMESMISGELSDMVKVYQNGTYVGEYQGINFIGTTIVGNPSINLTADVQIPGETTTIQLDVTTDGQTSFDVPSDFMHLIQVTVNGVSDSDFSYNSSSQMIEFDSLNSDFILETSDEILLVYVAVTS